MQACVANGDPAGGRRPICRAIFRALGTVSCLQANRVRKGLETLSLACCLHKEGQSRTSTPKVIPGQQPPNRSHLPVMNLRPVPFSTLGYLAAAGLSGCLLFPLEVLLGCLPALFRRLLWLPGCLLEQQQNESANTTSK